MARAFDRREGLDGQFSIDRAARTWSTFWLALQAVGWTPEMAATPSSRPVLLSFRRGPGSCDSTLTPSPQFLDLIMGWPIGWTDPLAPVTGYAAWLQRSRGQFSNLLTDFPPDGFE